MGFPRRLHFIYLDEPIPPERQACIDSVTALHPGWDVTVWTSLDQFGPLRNQRVFDRADYIAPPAPKGNPHQIRTNVLRFEIMARYGGVFCDSDLFALKPFDPVIDRIETEGKDGALAWEIEGRWLGEAVIFARPEAPFMERIVKHLQAWAFVHARSSATRTVGPQYITPLLQDSAELRNVCVLPQRSFFPARHNQPELSDALVSGEKTPHPDTLGVHLFQNYRRKRALGLL